MASANIHGTMCWLEIPVLSAVRAASFYTAVFGWECTPSHGSANPPSNGTISNTEGPGTIHIFRKDGGPGNCTLHGAFIQLPEGCLIRAWEPDNPEMAVLTTFAVESIEDTLMRVEGLGGSMHSPKTTIGRNMGYFARFIDCEGNLQGIWAQR
ncbi:unnamed protein product [Discula destructiva]